MGVTRRMRLDAPLSTHVDAFRGATDSKALRDALAQIAMRLVDTQDREQFQRADGTTAILDHLARIWEEQATLAYAWQASHVFGTTWAEHEVHDSLVLTLVAICHASVDASIAKEMNELHAIVLLVSIYTTLPSHLRVNQIHVLKCIRNLCFVDFDLATSLPRGFIQAMWDTLLQSNEVSIAALNSPSTTLPFGKLTGFHLSSPVKPERQEIAADILANIAFHDPTHVNATQQQIAATLTFFFTPSASQSASSSANQTGSSIPAHTVALQIALADLICNLCCDASYCLLLIYELDERKPRSYHRHSGAVFFADLTEKMPEPALRQNMEALAHNISWSDPAGKRNVQKLGLSSYLRVFAAEPAINN